MPHFRSRPTKRAQELRNNPTDAEKRLWSHLSRRQLEGFKFSRQKPVGPFICDFICRERGLVVELDGGQHAIDAARDRRRTAYLEQQGLTVLRFWNNDVLQNTEGVLQAVLAKLEKLPAKFAVSHLPLAGGEEPRSGEGVGKSEIVDRPQAGGTHPQPPPASGRGLS